VFQLLLAQPTVDEADLDGGLLAALREVLLVERKAQLAVFEDEVLAGVVVAAAPLFHVKGPGLEHPPGRRDHTSGSCSPARGECVFASSRRQLLSPESAAIRGMRLYAAVHVAPCKLDQASRWKSGPGRRRSAR